MKLTNQQIYNYANSFANLNIDICLPVRINFFLNRNIELIKSLGEEIEDTRLQIAQSFGELNSEGTQYVVPSEQIPQAQKELEDLFNIVQEVNIHTFTLDEFDGIELPYEQTKLIMFMIEEG